MKKISNIGSYVPATQPFNFLKSQFKLLFKFIRKANKTSKKISLENKKYLLDLYQKDIKNLQNLIRQDLSDWMK